MTITPFIFSDQVRGIRLVGMLLLVYVKSYLRDFISEVHADHVGTGIMGMMVSIYFY